MESIINVWVVTSGTQLLQIHDTKWGAMDTLDLTEQKYPDMELEVCDAIELLLPQQQMSLLCPRWRAERN